MDDSDSDQDDATVDDPNVRNIAFGREWDKTALTVVMRGDEYLVVKNQWNKLYNLGGSIRSFGRDDHHFVNATDEELVQLRKALSSKSTISKATLVEIRYAASITPNCPPSIVETVMAFASWKGPTRLVKPSPDARGDSDDDDDSDDDGDGDDPEVISNRYGVSPEQRRSGILGVHLAGLKSYFRTALDPERESRQLAHITVKNIEQTLALYIGFSNPAETLKVGGLCVLDGARIYSFIRYLREVRKLTVATILTYVGSLAKTAEFILLDVVGEQNSDWAKEYMKHLKNTVKQLEHLKITCPVLKPTFRQLVGNGGFVHLEEITKRTIPSILESIEAFRSMPSKGTASGVRNAVLLAFSASDEFNRRPGEVSHLNDASIRGRCHAPGCDAPGCTGNSVRILPNGEVEVILPHHKTSRTTGRVRTDRLLPGTVIARVLTCLVNEVVPFVRKQTGVAGNCIILRKDGQPLKSSKKGSQIVKSALMNAGAHYLRDHPEDGENRLAKLCSRSCRCSFIVFLLARYRAQPELFPHGISDLEVIAGTMGNSLRQWTRCVLKSCCFFVLMTKCNH